MEAARLIITKYGSENITVRKIAKNVGISETAIYRHFKSKKEILSSLVENTGESLIGDILKASVIRGSSLETLNRVLKSDLSSFERKRGISFQVIAEILSLGDKQLNKQVSRLIDSYLTQLKNLLAEGVKSGEIRNDIDLEAAACVLFGIVQSNVYIWTLRNLKCDPQQNFEAMWNVFCEAVTKHNTIAYHAT